MATLLSAEEAAAEGVRPAAEADAATKAAEEAAAAEAEEEARLAAEAETERGCDLARRSAVSVAWR